MAQSLGLARGVLGDERRACGGAERRKGTSESCTGWSPSGAITGQGAGVIKAV